MTGIVLWGSISAMSSPDDADDGYIMGAEGKENGQTDD